jgi:alpha-ribazole phosphatase
MIVYLLRHTKTEIKDGTCYGQSDIGVSKSFYDEQTAIKERLSTIAFDSIFSSPLKRCLQLAEALCPDNMRIIIDNRLMEMNFGTWEMKNWQEISKSSEAQNWFNDYINVKCPGGESFKDLYIRVKGFLDMLKNQKRYQQPLIVTHAGVIRAMYCIMETAGFKESFGLNVGFGQLKTFHL